MRGLLVRKKQKKEEGTAGLLRGQGMGRHGLLRLTRPQMADWARPGWFGPVSPISLFFLSVFHFFHIFCKTDPKQFKPICKFF
jgi:hypothetical protein